MPRDRKGFQDEITFVTPGKTEALAISLWDNKESADAYNRATGNGQTRGTGNKLSAKWGRTQSAPIGVSWLYR